MITGWRFETPTQFGWFHLMWIGIMIIEIVLFLIYFKNKNEKRDDKIVLIYGLILLTIEIYKQIFYTIDAGHYQWYAFPFQFCSTPMYVYLIIPFIKNVRIKDALYKYVAFFGLVAGLAVMAYPGDVFTSYVTISTHTMIWHSSMVVVGVYLIHSKGYCKDIRNIFKNVIPGLAVLASFMGIALIMNIVMYNSGILNGQIFNMFYIGPYYSCSLPILSLIYPNVPYIVFLLLYVVAFGLGIAIVNCAAFGFNELNRVISKPKNSRAFHTI